MNFYDVTRDILGFLKSFNEIPNNITLGSYSEPPQCMPEDVKVQNDSISAYHKYYQEYKKDFAVWTARPTPEFMYADL